jgi:hypothetical protein
LYLVTQQYGGDLKEGKVLAGLFGLHSNVLKGYWKDIANKLGLLIIELGKEICSDNISIEIELSPIDETTEHKNISACRDCYWDKQLSDRRYYSISCCSMMIGCRS